MCPSADCCVPCMCVQCLATNQLFWRIHHCVLYSHYFVDGLASCSALTHSLTHSLTPLLIQPAKRCRSGRSTPSRWRPPRCSLSSSASSSTRESVSLPLSLPFQPLLCVCTATYMMYMNVYMCAECTLHCQQINDWSASCTCAVHVCCRFAQYRMSFALINLFIAVSGSLLLIRKWHE
jgi:hypothetical protein